jgi:hypothetical protein
MEKQEKNRKQQGRQQVKKHVARTDKKSAGPGVKDKNRRKEERESEPEKDQATVPENTTPPPPAADEKEPRVNEDEQRKIVNNPGQGTEDLDKA